MATLLQQAIDLAKSGERDAAEMLIRQVLETDPNNEVAWIWLSGVSRDVLVKRTALERALQLNPDNQLAKEGLKRFGGDVPEEPQEPEPPAIETPMAPIPPDEMPIGTGESPAIAVPPEDLPPIIAPDTPSDVDWSVDAFAEDLAAPPPLTTEDAPVFEDLPGDFDFNLDEPPVFDLDLETLEKTGEPPAVIGVDDFSFGADEEIPALTVPPLGDELGAGEPMSDRLEDMLAQETNLPEDMLESEIEEEPDIEPETLTAAEALEDITPEAVAEEDIHELLRQKRRRNNRLLIIAATFFAIMVLGSCSLYYYVTEVADIYLIMPQLAGEELRKEAPKPKNGVSVIDFDGFPASSATINWTADSDVPTCQGQTVGLKIDFHNGDPAGLYSNRACNNDACTFQKDITPDTIKKVTVTYICGKNATITLHK